MNPPRQAPPDYGFLWWVLRLQWAWGLLPLLFLTEISRAALIVSAAAFLAGMFLDRNGIRREALLRASSPLLLTAVAASAADFMFGSRDLLYSISMLVLGIQSVRFILPKGVRGGWQLCAISFLEFLVSAASTTELQFALFAFVYVGLCAGAMWALQVEAERENGETSGSVRSGFAAKILLVAAAGGIVFTALLFILTPRVGIGQLLRSFRRAEGITGFSDTISLREVTGIKSDRRVAARIEFPGALEGVSPGGLYLRGATYSRFDGKTWTRTRRYGRRLPRSGFYYVVGQPPPGAHLSEAEIILDAMDNPAIFVYGSPVYFEGDLGDVWTEGEGSYSLSLPSHPPLRYRILFSHEASRFPAMDPEARRRYLELPAGLEELSALSAEIAGAGLSDAEKVENALRHFGTGFRYTITDPAASVRDFLFVKRAGYCEHYATALALLLRASGIPSRLAAGYLGGEWSEPGKYLIVRQSDAHAWTEAWIDGRWVTLDATPALGEQSPFFTRTGKAGIYLDWFRQRWDKYVVNYSLKMQADGMAKGWRTLARVKARIAFALASGKSIRLRDIPAAALLLLLVPAVYFLARHFGKIQKSAGAGQHDGSAPLPRPYARLVRRLAAAGLREKPGLTLEEMMRKAVRFRPELATDAARFLELYHRDRFGAPPLPRGDDDEAGRLARLLAREIGRSRAA